MYISLKLRVFGNKLSLIYYGLMTSRLYNSSLMESKCTEITSTKASSIANKRKLYFFDSWYAPILFIHRMIGAHIFDGIDIIHLLPGKRLLRRILKPMLTRSKRPAKLMLRKRSVKPVRVMKLKEPMEPAKTTASPLKKILTRLHLNLYSQMHMRRTAR